jgi:hypothetical protein
VTFVFIHRRAVSAGCRRMVSVPLEPFPARQRGAAARAACHPIARRASRLTFLVAPSRARASARIRAGWGCVWTTCSPAATWSAPAADRRRRDVGVDVDERDRARARADTREGVSQVVTVRMRARLATARHLAAHWFVARTTLNRWLALSCRFVWISHEFLDPISKTKFSIADSFVTCVIPIARVRGLLVRIKGTGEGRNFGGSPSPAGAGRAEPERSRVGS